MGWMANQWEQMRGNIKWDISKTIGAVVLGASYVLLQKLRHLSWDWYVFGGILFMALITLLVDSVRKKQVWDGRSGDSIFKRPPKAGELESKLVIHSAVYGTGPSDDMLVTNRLRTAVRDALVVPVDNNLVPRDPAIGKVKRLAVEYSYGNPSIQRASRPEGERLVLPEDSEIQRLRDEIEQLTRPEHAANLRDRIFDVCLRLKAFLDKHGKRPDPYLIPIKDKDEYVRLYQETVQAWDDKFQADYWLNWKDKILALRNELVLMSLTDDILDKKLMEADTSNLTDKTVEAINEKLRMLAAQLD